MTIRIIYKKLKQTLNKVYNLLSSPMINVGSITIVICHKKLISYSIRSSSNNREKKLISYYLYTNDSCVS